MAAKWAQSRSRFEAEIAGLQAVLAERERAQRESSAARAEMEANLKSEIGGLQSDLEQKRQQLDLRDDAWRQAETDIVSLQQRIAELRRRTSKPSPINRT